MTTDSIAIQRRRIYDISPARKLVMGIVEILVSLLIFFVFAIGIKPGTETKFVMTPGGLTVGKMADWIIPTQLTLILLASFCLIIGIYQLIKGIWQVYQWFGWLNWAISDICFSDLAGIWKICKPGRNALKCGTPLSSNHPGLFFRDLM
jgi:hypothetical protein